MGGGSADVSGAREPGAERRERRRRQGEGRGSDLERFGAHADEREGGGEHGQPVVVPAAAGAGLGGGEGWETERRNATRQGCAEDGCICGVDAGRRRRWGEAPRGGRRGRVGGR